MSVAVVRGRAERTGRDGRGPDRPEPRRATRRGGASCGRRWRRHRPRRRRAVTVADAPGGVEVATAGTRQRTSPHGRRRPVAGARVRPAALRPARSLRPARPSGPARCARRVGCASAGPFMHPRRLARALSRSSRWPRGRAPPCARRRPTRCRPLARRPSPRRLGDGRGGGNVVVVVLGGYVVAAALSEPAGPPVGIRWVRVRPLSGMGLAGRRPGARCTFAAGHAGQRRPAVTVHGPFRGDARALAEAYSEVLSDRSRASSRCRASVERRAVGRRSVRAPVRLRRRHRPRPEPPIEGEVTVARHAVRDSVVFDAWAPAGLLSFVRSRTCAT